MSEAICEYVDSRGVALRVDRAGGVLRGVKLIGLESANGRRYRPTALANAAQLYEGAKVNVNHPKEGPLAPRDYRDRLGVIRQVEFRPAEGLFGNLHFNPRHALAEQLAWDAEHNPRNVGFSHNVLARVSREEDAVIVDEITHVQSVDLVADPAATQGLFEDRSERCVASGEGQEERGEAATLGNPLPTPSASTTALRSGDFGSPMLGCSHPRKGEGAGEDVMVAAIADAEQRAHLAERRLFVVEQLARHGLIPAGCQGTVREAMGAAFFDALLTANDETSALALIVERAALVDAGRIAARATQGVASLGALPRSSEQGSALGQLGQRCVSMQEFVRAVRNRK